MMWKPFLIFSLLNCLSNTAFAANLSIDTGEHEGFTRLVVALPNPESAWSLSGAGRSRTLSINGEKNSFDFESAFNKITRNRLKALRTDEDAQLVLELNCDCRLASYTWQSSHIVIDIHDHQSADTHGSVAAMTSNLTFPKLENSSDLAHPHLQLGETAKALKLDTDLEHAKTEPFRLAENNSRKNPHQLNLERNELFEGVLAATSRGLLFPSEEPKYRKPIEKKNVRPEIVDEQIPNILLQNAFERRQQELTSSTLPINPIDCTSDTLLRISNWNEGETYDSRVAQFRTALLNERAEVQDKAAINLAKTYIYFGMGSEARAVLKMVDNSVAELELLSELAHLIDQDLNTQNQYFSGQHKCDSMSAFWAVLSAGPDVNLENINTSGVLKGFYDLPAHLRQHLANQIGLYLVANNERPTAEKILSSFNHAPEHAQPVSEFLEGEIANDKGEADTAHARFAQVIADDSVEAPQAIVKIIHSNEGKEHLNEAELAELANTFSMEHRDSESGPELRRAHLLARLKNLEFDAALDVLNEIAELDGDEEYNNALQVLSELLTSTSNDDDFLRISINNLSAVSDQLSNEHGNAVARRLLALRVPEKAQLFVSSGADGAIGRDRRKIRAQAEIELENPLNAAAHLVGLSGNDVDLIRADAERQLGTLDIAETMYRAIGKIERADSIAWRDGQWEKLKLSDDELKRQVSQLMLSRFEIDALRPQNQTLGYANSLLDASASARDTLEKLLAHHQFESASSSKK